jgi:hypothetical protein
MNSFSSSNFLYLYRCCVVYNRSNDVIFYLQGTSIKITSTKLIFLRYAVYLAVVHTNKESETQMKEYVYPGGYAVSLSASVYELENVV